MLRILRSALLPAALGVLTTYAVAWLLAAGIAPERPVWSNAQRTFEFAPGRVFTLTRGEWTGGEATHIIDLWSDAMPAYAEWFDPLMPSWAHPILIRPQGPPPESKTVRSVVARGWPLRSLWCAWESTSGPLARGPRRVTAGVQVSDSWAGFRTRSPTDPPVILPTRPLWPRFLLNAAIFSTAWSAVLFAPPAARREFRRRRGRCAGCGYDLRTLDRGVRCPECGRRQAAPAAPATDSPG